jgi:VWFA-related protein
MFHPGCARFAAGTAAALALLVSPPRSDLSGQSQTFRSGIAVVPLDVRVADRKGSPVNDLTKADFTVYEDGVRQEITHFERQTLSPMKDSGPDVLVPGTSITPGVRAQNRRVFLIALGHPWLPTARFGLVDALIKFLRDRLLPQDYAGIAGFGRVTDLTTDRESLVRVLLRLRELQKAVEDTRDFTERRRLTRAIYANPASQSPELDMRKRMDAVFASTSGGTHLLSRESRPEWQPLLSAIASHAKTAETAANPPSAYTGDEGVRAVRDNQLRQEIVGLQANVLNMFNVLQYLRYVDGEKHVIYFGGGLGTAVEDDRSVARIAGDARVAIHMVSGWNGLSLGGSGLFGDMQSKNIAAQTGGQVFLNRYADVALAKIDEITRVGYLLAYSPAKAEADGRHRKIKITVARPAGATVMNRQSYLATDKPADYGFCSDARQRLVGEKWMTLDLKLKDDTFARALAEGFHHAASVPVTGPVRFVKVVVYDYATGRAGSAIVRVN